MAKYLDSNGLLYLWQKIRAAFVSDVTWDSTNNKLVRKKKTGTNGAEESADIVTLSTVATSGSYADLSNKPTIPAGTVTSVRVQATSPVASSTDTEQTSSLSTTISLSDAYGDTKNPYGTKTANYVLAGPASGSASAPTFRALGDSDIPNTVARLSSPAFTNVPTAPTASSGTNTTQIATTEFVATAVANAISGSASFQGTVSANTTIESASYKAGMYWVVATAGTYVGQTCEVGDMIFAVSNKNTAYSASDFSVVQNNLELISNSDIDTVVAS